MIVKKYSCRVCGSFNIVKNGRNKSGSQQYLFKDCRASKVLEPKLKYSEERKEEKGNSPRLSGARQSTGSGQGFRRFAANHHKLAKKTS